MVPKRVPHLAKYEMNLKKLPKISKILPKWRNFAKSGHHVQRSVQFKLARFDLNRMQNLRHWISQTILSRLIKEIESINKTLAQHGISGELNSFRLKKHHSLQNQFPLSRGRVSSGFFGQNLNPRKFQRNPPIPATVTRKYKW